MKQQLFEETFFTSVILEACKLWAFLSHGSCVAASGWQLCTTLSWRNTDLLTQIPAGLAICLCIYLTKLLKKLSESIWVHCTKLEKKFPFSIWCWKANSRAWGKKGKETWVIIVNESFKSGRIHWNLISVDKQFCIHCACLKNVSILKRYKIWYLKG